MAFNPRPNIDKLEDYDITKVHELPPPVPKQPAPSIACGIRREYYMEWWRIGDDHNAVEAGHFHTGNLRHLLTVFLGTKKYTIIYLQRVEDEKIIRDARNTLRR